MLGIARWLGMALAIGIALPPPMPALAQATTIQDAAAARRFTREPNMDRSGNDLRKVELAETDSVAQCERLCRLASACVAFTFVKRSTTVPRPVCRLKDVVPTAYESSCCTSGVLER